MTIIIQKMELPFTRIREMQQKGTNTITAVFSMILLGLLAGFVYLTSFISVWITFLICGSCVVFITLAFRAVRRNSNLFQEDRVET